MDPQEPPDASQLVDGYSAAGIEFASILRTELAAAVYGTAAQQRKARAILRKAAQDATFAMERAGRLWLNNPRTVAGMVITGQKLAATDVRIGFGGPNVGLIQRLKVDIARDLGRASNSTLPFLDKTLREATAIAAQRLHKGGQVAEALGTGFNKDITASLLSSAEAEKVSRQSSAQLLADLDLDKGDKVLFLSGYRMEASAYSRLLTRTRSMEALNLGKAGEYVSNGYMLIQTNEHDGVREDDPCFILQGRVWALGPNEYGIPILPAQWGLPPWHPNCVHSYGAWQPKFRGGDAAVRGVLEDHRDDAQQIARYA